MPLRLHYCDHFELPLPPEHRFPTRKYRLLREALEREGGFELLRSRFAEREELELVHDSGYVSDFLKGTLDPAVVRRIGFPWSQQLVQRTLASVGGTIEAARHAMEHGFSGNLGGGTHHAFAEEGAGYCVFNDLAVAARCLLSEGLARRVAVLDLDVHQGDGTAAIFRDVPAVLTVSVHGANNFPFKKQESKIDIALPDGSGDDEFLAALARCLPRVLAFGPDIVIYQSGVDGLVSDTLGRLCLTRTGLRERDRQVFTACRQANVPVAVTLGGGYSDPLQPTVKAHVNTFRVARNVFEE